MRRKKVYWNDCSYRSFAPVVFIQAFYCYIFKFSSFQNFQVSQKTEMNPTNINWSLWLGTNEGLAPEIWVVGLIAVIVILLILFGVAL